MIDDNEIIDQSVSREDRKRYALVDHHGACHPKHHIILTVDQHVERWYPSRAIPARTKAVCTGCQVRGMCLDLALKYGEYGVWGGTSERERKAMKEAAA